MACPLSHMCIWKSGESNDVQSEGSIAGAACNCTARPCTCRGHPWRTGRTCDGAVINQDFQLKVLKMVLI